MEKMMVMKGRISVRYCDSARRRMRDEEEQGK